MVEEDEEGGKRTEGRTGTEEKRGGGERRRVKQRRKEVEKSPAPKRKGRSKFQGDWLEPANQERDPEKDLERGVTGEDSPPPPPPQLPLRLPL